MSEVDRAVYVIVGLMEIAEIAMPDSYFAEDSRVQAAKDFLEDHGTPWIGDEEA